MIVMLPWLALEEPLRLEEFEVLQFMKGMLPAGFRKRKQSVVDRLFRPYRESGEPVRSACLLKLKGRDYLDDLSNEERSEAFAIAELLAFSGLSAREFFGTGMLYWNTDHFSCVIQTFGPTFSGTAIERRRRDGRTLNYLPARSFRVDKPHHIGGGIARTRLDIPLLKALLAARKCEWWDTLFEGIFWFNRANTDSDTITKEIEAVEMVGAFERALGLTGGDERALRQAIVAHFVPTEEVACSDSPRLEVRRFKGCKSVREAWICDLFRLRGDHSHGRKKAKYRSAWSLDEHLLLAAFAFPLLVKELLSRRGLYTPERDDVIAINAFENLALIKPFDRPKDADRSPWSRVLAETSFKFPQYVDIAHDEPLIDASNVSWGRRT